MRLFQPLPVLQTTQHFGHYKNLIKDFHNDFCCIFSDKAKLIYCVMSNAHFNYRNLVIVCQKYSLTARFDNGRSINHTRICVEYNAIFPNFLSLNPQFSGQVFSTKLLSSVRNYTQKLFYPFPG